MTSFAMIGLGKMGANMARRLALGGARAALFDRDAQTTSALATELGAFAASSLSNLIEHLEAPRLVWLMLPAGDATEAAIAQLQALLSEGDVIIDGANSFYKDSLRRAATLKRNGLGFVDCGVSGGVHGLANGYCLMAGGAQDAIDRLKPYLRLLAPAPDTGWLHAGPAGAGHFTKMVHNGIEYGMMQAIAEGFEVMEKSNYNLNLEQVARVFNHGSVVRSWLMELTESAFSKDPKLDTIKGVMHSSGEGKWTLETALDMGVPTPVIALSLLMR
jgi:6-phosphogluconate dehydrogenase